MSTYSNGDYAEDLARKILQTRMWDFTKRYSKLFGLLLGAPGMEKFGNMISTRTMEGPGGWYRLIETRFKRGYAASIVNPSATGDIAGPSAAPYGSYDPAIDTMRIVWTYLIGRSTINEEQFMQIPGNYNDQNYLNWVDEKQAGIAKIYGHVISALLYGTGEFGKLTAVAEGASQVVSSATTEYTIAVDNVQFLPAGQDVWFRASNGAAISDSVPGRVIRTATALGTGAGSVVFTFPSWTATNFTINNQAIICIPECVSGTTNRLYAYGLKSMISQDAFPRNEAANDPLDDPQYKSPVFDCGSNYLTWELVSAMIDKVSQQLSTNPLNDESEDMAVRDDFNQLIPGKFGLLCNPNVPRNFQNNKYNNKWQDYGDGGINAPLKTVTDRGFNYTEFGGVKFLVDLACPNTDAWIFSLNAFTKRILKPWGPLMGDRGSDTPFRQYGNLNSEFVRSLAWVLFPIFRDHCANFTGTNLAPTPDTALSAAAPSA